MVLNYEKIRKNLQEEFSYNVNSLSKKSKISKSCLYNFFNIKRKHNIYRDLYVLLKIASSLNVPVESLIN